VNERGAENQHNAARQRNVERSGCGAWVMDEFVHSHAYQMIGAKSNERHFEKIGMSGFGSSSVNGRKRMPRPAQKNA